MNLDLRTHRYTSLRQDGHRRFSRLCLAIEDASDGRVGVTYKGRDIDPTTVRQIAIELEYITTDREGAAVERCERAVATKARVA